jgi:hypothetical protein
MAKIQQEIQKKTIPFGKYRTDSFKLSIDTDKLRSITIPENFTIIDSDTGEELEQFKRNSFKVPYLNTHIYLSKFRSNLPKQTIQYERLVILFSSKVCGDSYFDGIQKHNVIDVLNFLKEKQYIDFTDVLEVYKNLYTKDHDIKVDFKFTHSEREKIAKFNLDLSHMFQFDKENCKVYKSQKELGIVAFHRDRTTLAKPFLKFYDKAKELNRKHPELLLSLPDSIRDEVLSNFIYRFEYTLKTKAFFTKFGLSNRLEEVFEVADSKWQEIGKTLLNTLFQVKIKKIRDTSKLSYSERILALYFFEDIQKNNLSPMAVKSKYTSIQKTKDQKYKAGLLFDKMYQYIAEDKNNDIMNDHESIKHYYTVFGFI